jgi:hypothetical protein
MPVARNSVNKLDPVGAEEDGPKQTEMCPAPAVVGQAAIPATAMSRSSRPIGGCI